MTGGSDTHPVGALRFVADSFPSIRHVRSTPNGVDQANPTKRIAATGSTDTTVKFIDWTKVW